MAKYTCPHCGTGLAITTTLTPFGGHVAWCIVIRCNLMQSKPAYGPTREAAIRAFKEQNGAARTR